MTARRLLKAGEAIREVVSMAILTELRDPRVKNVTVLGVEVAPDMREAKVIVSVMGNKTQQSTSLRGLQNAAGFLQAKIADRIDTRYTPRLTFVLDDGIKKSLAVSQILEQIAAERAADERVKSGREDEDRDEENREDAEIVADDEATEDAEEGLDAEEASREFGDTDASNGESKPRTD
ncbi:MAG: 30S ribosome-binding factor RbfA [Pirellula sp.]|jgi:ribosome-binding factor A|nr:30S ribosome-binding factor RbfA [Pirellula sp.]